jgi:hypothetical protein
MQLKVTIEIWQKGEWYVATCPELGFCLSRSFA